MANMHATEIGPQVPPPPIAMETNPVAEISAMLLRGQAFTGATGVALLTITDGWLVCRVATGSAAPDFGARMAVEGTFLGLCARSKKAERTEDTDTDLRVENASYSRVKPRSILATPVRSGADVLGVLAVFSTSAGAFNNTHVAILRTMSDALSRMVPQLPPMPIVPEPVIQAAGPSARQSKSETVITMPVPAAPTPVEKTEEPKVLSMPQPIAAAEPPVQKPDSDLLTLADDPGPRVRIRTLPPLERAAVLEPPKFTQGPFFDLPRSNRRRRRLLKRVAAAAVAVLAGTMSYGAYAMRSQSEPKIFAAKPNVPAVFQEQAAAVQAAQVKAAPVSTPATQPKEADVKVAAVIEAPEPIRTPSAPLAVKPLAKSAGMAEVDAPALEIQAAPLPVIAAPMPTPKVEVRRAQTTPAQVVQRVNPEYPMAALRTKAGGDVKLTAVVLKDGSVGAVKVISGNPMLRDAAVHAVKQWRYYPGTLDGHAIESTAEIVLRFAAPK